MWALSNTYVVESLQFSVTQVVHAHRLKTLYRIVVLTFFTRISDSSKPVDIAVQRDVTTAPQASHSFFLFRNAAASTLRSSDARMDEFSDEGKRRLRTVFPISCPSKPKLVGNTTSACFPNFAAVLERIVMRTPYAAFS